MNHLAMTSNYLLTIGWQLSKRATYLVEDGPDQPVGFWRGQPAVRAPDPTYHHWLSLPAELFTARWGCVWASIFTSVGGTTGGAVVFDDACEACDGRPLFASDEETLPPLEGVFQSGDAEVEEWLAANGWNPEWEYNSNFPDAGPAEEYVVEYQKTCGIYRSVVFAVIGGWHFTWPDEPWVAEPEGRLALWTIADSEPWVEVWETPDGEFRVVQRIT